MSKVQDVKKAPDFCAGGRFPAPSERYQKKGLTEEDILNGSAEAFRGGWNRVKLYFMLGLPTETPEDMQGIAELSEKVAEEYYNIPKEERSGKVQVTASTSFFVPEAVYAVPVGQNVYQRRISGAGPHCQFQDERDAEPQESALQLA